MVAGVGFEPHDLRVMSPTSYQAALPRDILWCRKPGSNRYGTFVPLDFKSKASANSAIPARWHTLVSLHPCLQGLYSISPLGLFVNTYRQSFLHQAENKHCRNAETSNIGMKTETVTLFDLRLQKYRQRNFIPRCAPVCAALYCTMPPPKDIRPAYRRAQV